MTMKQALLRAWVLLWVTVEQVKTFSTGGGIEIQ